MLEKNQNFEAEPVIYPESYDSIRALRVNLISEIEKDFKIDLNNQDVDYIAQKIVEDSDKKDKLYPTLFKLQEIIEQEINLINKNPDLPQESLSYLTPLREIINKAVESTTRKGGWW